ncbi:MAG TPA: hypothetical protein PKK74_02845 [Candidatus Methanoculleus thermohydrogenotrophicum]|jgi:GMP synthase-like glutamine amidotransferase|nr:hypothetical protein [Candidatus Methanoculleus thermohydrogenotrophicum]NLM81151.1 hypothetical protein [Candidatus Methanoculleus thermohydrogenotrophicum]HOB17621.1 hypothetical protein [Candidatus Methanoculleus thermohydrogenotrophicum]HPZ38298.1 hypothetical protein [Candidatus Methanoculleus thermohydrogenotrophicum]
MILVIDLCYRDGSLSRDEFVGPVMRTLQEAGAQFAVRHYAAVSAPDLEAANAVILCGTALKDTGFMEHPGRFGWLAVFERPVLGISSGMLTLAGAFGGVAEPCPGIGMTDVRVIAPDPLFDGRETFAAYELHEFAVQVPRGFIPLAVSDRCVQAIRHRSLLLYGLLFHPEVRSEWIIERFLRLAEPALSV